MNSEQIHKYYIQINKSENGNYIVHKDGCPNIPSIQEALYIGEYLSCAGAVVIAKIRYPNAIGCWHCSRECYVR